MISKIKPIVLDGHNFAIKYTYMETLLKSKGLWKFVKTTIAGRMDVDAMFSIDIKKDKVVGVITTYNLGRIRFHTSGIDCPHAI